MCIKFSIYLFVVNILGAVLLPTVGDPPMKFYCDECIMSFNSQIQMEQHLSSPKHINRVQRQQACEQSRGRTIIEEEGEAREGVEEKHVSRKTYSYIH